MCGEKVLTGVSRCLIAHEESQRNYCSWIHAPLNPEASTQRPGPPSLGTHRATFVPRAFWHSRAHAHLQM